ncbi:hypothetical protein HGRIS_001552 [Hohenbuehelia grisea]|uniref:Man(5)GlcNAc(2)-PP-dolichol translocation protein RFT1 n=1 Tax=Hohenbuehelia grisea TaxID=104357 RepID=A0ABR3JRH2_9AGAR
MKNAPVPQEKALRRNFDLPLLNLSMMLNAQFVLKHILTEGDKVVLSWYSPMAEQGGYAVAANYGSLIARLVFQPIEETSRVFFAKTLSATPGQSAPKTIKDESVSDEQQNAIPLPALKQAAAFLSSILQTQLFLAMPIIVFGHVYLPIVLSFLLPARFLATSAPQRLYAWVYYLPVFAVNGVLEAFVAGTATARDVVKQCRCVDDVVLRDLHIHGHRALSNWLQRRIPRVRQHRRTLHADPIRGALLVQLPPSSNRNSHLHELDSATPAHQAQHPPRCQTPVDMRHRARHRHVQPAAETNRPMRRGCDARAAKQNVLAFSSCRRACRVGRGPGVGVFGDVWVCSGRHMEILRMRREEREGNEKAQ